MNSLMKTLCTATCALFFISSVAALSCHVCNSHKKGEGDCFSTEKVVNSSAFIQNCSELPDGSKYTYCRKIEQDIPAHEQHEAHTRIIRQCGYHNVTAVLNDAGCYKAGLVNGGRQIVCTCATDGCNGSSSLQHISIVNLFAVVTFVISLAYKML